MKPLILLLVSFILGIILSLLFTGDPHIAFNGNFSMALMLGFTAIGHFKFRKGMAMMLPASLPAREAAVFISGIWEILLGIALVIPVTRNIAAIALILMLLLMLPANIYAAKHHVNYEKGTFDGPGPQYLWFRIPLQFFFIGWILSFTFFWY